MSKRHFTGKLVDLTAETVNVGGVGSTVNTLGTPTWTNRVDGIVRLDGTPQYTNLKYSFMVQNGIQYTRVANTTAVTIPNTGGLHTLTLAFPTPVGGAVGVQQYDDTNALTSTGTSLSQSATVIVNNGTAYTAVAHVYSLSPGSINTYIDVLLPSAAQNNPVTLDEMFFVWAVSH